MVGARVLSQEWNPDAPDRREVQAACLEEEIPSVGDSVVIDGLSFTIEAVYKWGYNPRGDLDYKEHAVELHVRREGLPGTGVAAPIAPDEPPGPRAGAEVEPLNSDTGGDA